VAVEGGTPAIWKAAPYSNEVSSRAPSDLPIERRSLDSGRRGRPPRKAGGCSIDCPGEERWPSTGTYYRAKNAAMRSAGRVPCLRRFRRGLRADRMTALLTAVRQVDLVGLGRACPGLRVGLPTSSIGREPPAVGFTDWFYGNNPACVGVVRDRPLPGVTWKIRRRRQPRPPKLLRRGVHLVLRRAGRHHLAPFFWKRSCRRLSRSLSAAGA
jgi:hypothetical protein